MTKEGTIQLLKQIFIKLFFLVPHLQSRVFVVLFVCVSFVISFFALFLCFYLFLSCVLNSLL